MVITAGAGRSPPQQRVGHGQPVRAHAGLRTRLRVQSSRLESRRTAVRAGLQGRPVRSRRCRRIGPQPRTAAGSTTRCTATPTTCSRSWRPSTHSDVVFVGHSVSAMIGVLAANRDPSRFASLVLVGPSPRYVNEGGYRGGFEPADIEALLDALDANYLGWSAVAAPMMMGNPDRPELGERLTESFCRTDPDIARHFAHVTFLSDNRSDLAARHGSHAGPAVHDDAIAPLRGGRVRARARSRTARSRCWRPPGTSRSSPDPMRSSPPSARTCHDRAPTTRSSTARQRAGCSPRASPASSSRSTTPCSAGRGTRADDVIGSSFTSSAGCRKPDLLRDPARPDAPPAGRAEGGGSHAALRRRIAPVGAGQFRADRRGEPARRADRRLRRHRPPGV